MASEQPHPWFFLLLMAGATVLLGMVLYPIATELFLATILTTVLWPVQRWLTRRVRRRGIAAGLLTFAVVVVMLGPVAAIVTYVVRDGSDAVQFVATTAQSEHMTQTLSWLPESARDVTDDAIERMPKDLS